VSLARDDAYKEKVSGRSQVSGENASYHKMGGKLPADRQWVKRATHSTCWVMGKQS
jgi:hypothetical protein